MNINSDFHLDLYTEWDRIRQSHRQIGKELARRESRHALRPTCSDAEHVREMKRLEWQQQVADWTMREIEAYIGPALKIRATLFVRQCLTLGTIHAQ